MSKGTTAPTTRHQRRAIETDHRDTSAATVTATKTTIGVATLRLVAAMKPAKAETDGDGSATSTETIPGAARVGRHPADDRLALCVGVGGPVMLRDAEDVASTLRDRCGYPTTGVTLLTGRAATAEVVENELGRLLRLHERAVAEADEAEVEVGRRVEDEDPDPDPPPLLFVYVSCHASRVRADDSIASDTHLHMHGGGGDVDDRSYSSGTAGVVVGATIELGRLRRRIVREAVGNVFVALDCCHAGAIARSEAIATTRTSRRWRDGAGPGRVFLTSSTADGRSFYTRDTRNSHFTDTLLRFLRWGPGATEATRATLDEMSELRRCRRRDRQRKRRQRSRRRGGGEGRGVHDPGAGGVGVTDALTDAEWRRCVTARSLGEFVAFHGRRAAPQLECRGSDFTVVWRTDDGEEGGAGRASGRAATTIGESGILAGGHNRERPLQRTSGVAEEWRDVECRR